MAVNTGSAVTETEIVAKDSIVALTKGVDCLERTVNCLIQCYSNPSITNKDFVEHRNELMEMALVYSSYHVPQALEMVKNLKMVATMYDVMDETMFCEQITVVADEMETQAKKAQQVTHDHKKILEQLYSLKLKNKDVQGRIEEVRDTNEMRSLVYKQDGEHKRARSTTLYKVGMAFVAPALLVDAALCGGMTSGMLTAGSTLAIGLSEIVKAKGERKSSESFAKAEKEREEANKANEALTMTGPLLEAMENFGHVLFKLTAFFARLDLDVSAYRDVSLKVSNEVSKKRDGAVIFLKIMKSYSGRIIKACDLYMTIAPLMEAKLGGLSNYARIDASKLAITWVKSNSSVSLTEV